MMMVDDGGGRGVKNDQKSDDVINGRPLALCFGWQFEIAHLRSFVFCVVKANLFQKGHFHKSEYPLFCQLFGAFLNKYLF